MIRELDHSKLNGLSSQELNCKDSKDSPSTSIYDILTPDAAGVQAAVNMLNEILLFARKILTMTIFLRRGFFNEACLDELKGLLSIQHLTNRFLEIYHVDYDKPSERLEITMEFGFGTLYHLKRLIITQKVAYKNLSTDLRTQLEDQLKIFKALKLCHRDIKLPNIMVMPELHHIRYIVADFGCARRVNLDEDGMQEMEPADNFPYITPEIQKAFRNKSKTC